MYYLVRIPHHGGHDEYLIEKPAGLFDAVRRALAIHEERLGRWPDDNVVTVIEDGQQRSTGISQRAQCKAAAMAVKGRASSVADISSAPSGL